MPPIRPTQQFQAIAALRWAIFKNGLRRKGGAGELIARIITYPLVAAFIVGPTLLASSTAYYAASRRSYDTFAYIFWAVFFLSIVTSLNIQAPGLSFDPESLIRFPLTFSRYLTVRIFFGLLSTSTIVSTLCLLGAAAGASIAQPQLLAVFFAAALLLALANMFFIRMVFAWVDRWLATRRARELFTGLIIVSSLGIQWLNFNFNPGFNHGHRSAAKLTAVLHAYQSAEPFLHFLPPALAAAAIAGADHHQALSAVALLTGVLAYAAFFCFIFASRMHREYRGENLSEAPAQTTPTQPASIQAVLIQTAPNPLPTPSGHTLVHPAHAHPVLPDAPGLETVIVANLHKEWLYVRRNSSQLYGLLAPLAMVFIVAARFGSAMGHSPWLLPAAAGYSTMGIAALSYNSLGLDGPGVQFYFLAPARLGTILLAKNLFSFGLNLVSITLVVTLIIYNGGVPPLFTILNTVAWVVFASLVNVTVGNIRSITSPKKMDPTKVSRRQASQLSALLALGLIVVLGAAGAGLIQLGNTLGKPWLPFPILLTLAALAAFFYRQGLHSLDTLAYRNRETLIEELTKAT